MRMWSTGEEMSIGRITEIFFHEARVSFCCENWSLKNLSVAFSLIVATSRVNLCSHSTFFTNPNNHWCLKNTKKCSESINFWFLTTEKYKKSRAFYLQPPVECWSKCTLFTPTNFTLIQSPSQKSWTKKCLKIVKKIFSSCQRTLNLKPSERKSCDKNLKVLAWNQPFATTSNVSLNANQRA